MVAHRSGADLKGKAGLDDGERRETLLPCFFSRIEPHALAVTRQVKKDKVS